MSFVFHQTEAVSEVIAEVEVVSVVCVVTWDVDRESHFVAGSFFFNFFDDNSFFGGRRGGFWIYE